MANRVIRIRASSMGTLLDCGHRWEGEQLLGMRRPSSGRQQLGQAVHAGTAVFDAQRVIGDPMPIAEAVSEFNRVLTDKTEEVVWGDFPQKNAQYIGALLVRDYCQFESPKYDFVGVELEAKDMDIDCGNGVTIRLTGKMDRARVRVGSSGVGINDLKSGERAVTTDGRAATKGHGAQLGIYEMLLEHTTGKRVTEPATITGLRTTRNYAIGHATIPNTRSMLIGDAKQPGLLDYAADTLRSGLFRPNPRSQLCSKHYCARWQSCRFRDEGE